MKRIGVLVVSALIVALVVAACGGGTSAPTASTAPAAPTAASGGAEGTTTGASGGEAAESDRCGDRSRLSRNFYNWSDYIDPEILAEFEAECGVTVVYDTYSSNEDLLGKLQAGASGYDLIVPSDYMISIMIELGLLRELDHSNIPNLARIHERFIDPPYDPGNRYSVPYLWGTTGIGFDLAVVEEAPTSWAFLFDPEEVQKYNGKLTLLNDEREVIGAALKYLGYSLNSTDPAQLEEAKQTILAVKPYIAAFDSDTFGDLMVSGDFAGGHGWNGTYYIAIFENEDRDFGYVVPEEGGTIFTDNLAIPVSAPNPYTAEVLINYLMEPENAGRITNATYFASPNKDADEFILEEILTDPGIYPPEDVLDKLEFIVDVGGDAAQLYGRIWTEIKSQ
jgi:spermidine/putrescine-binding protein